MEENTTKSFLSSPKNVTVRKSRQDLYKELEDLKKFNYDIQFKLNKSFNTNDFTKQYAAMCGEGESRPTPQQDSG